jgi:hypothetical protein
MGISPDLSRHQGSKAASGQSAFARNSLCKILYCGSLAVVLLAFVAALTVGSAAQEERPEITPGERKVPKKKDAGPRAVAVLQLMPNGKSSLLPVAILVGGKFWDASAYKADPVPMALETGTVYEAERAGSSLGLFTVNSALHSKAVNVQSPWIGTGKWLPGGVETKTAPKAESIPVGIDNDNGEGPPRLTRDPQKVSRPALAAPAPPSTTDSNSSSSSSSSSSGDEPPRLTKSTPAPAPAPSAGSTAPGDSKPTDSKPADAKPSDAKPAEQAKVPESDSGASDSNRPTLRRGKPTEPLPADDVPGYSKPGAAAAAVPAPNADKTAATAGDKTAADKTAATTGPTQLFPAISDASGPEPKSFTFQWLKEEEGERRQQMETLAKEQIRAYVDARAKAKIVPPPTGTSTARRAPAAKTTTSKTKDPILDNVQMNAYDLWTNNQPVIVLTAEAHMPPPPAGTAFSAVDAELQYSILLIAYPDTYNNLHKIYSGVTDKFHLDLTPRLELIDALDADGDRRGELLFRETSDNGTGWVIYRASQDKLWKLFDSLHPE